MADSDNSADGYATEALRQEMAAMTSTQRAAVLMLLLGEEQASDIIRFLNPKEVQALGAAMVQVQDLSQEAINVVLDEFVATIKKQTSLALGTADYVEKVFKRAQICAPRIRKQIRATMCGACTLTASCMTQKRCAIW
jgi:hypothetical protein